jgi:hypothetical protein
MEGAVDDSGNGAEFRGLAAKDAVIGGLVPMMGKVDTRSQENDGRREQDARAEQVAEDDFDTVIVPRWRLGLLRVRLWSGRIGSGHQIFPQNPL